MPADDVDLARRLVDGDRRALSRAITLVESTRPDDRDRAVDVLAEVLPRTGGAVRLGISGPPGAGKSTFLNAFGPLLVRRGHRVAVLAVDPSSTRSGGSILGDKTRMPDLATRAEAFVRPSPAGATPGGVARRTREALLLCEAAGFNAVLVETVGVGQSETAVADMVDTMALLVAPGAGDDLQGIKRGIVELADLVVVTKADGALLPEARAAASDYRRALRLLRRRHRGWDPEVLLVSALAGDGLDAVADAVVRHGEALRSSGALDGLRREQRRAWLRTELEEQVREALLADRAVRRVLEELEASVADGRLPAPVAARRLLEAFRAGT